MKNTSLIWLILLSVVVTLAAIFYVLFPNELSENIVFISSTALLIVAVGNLIYGFLFASQQKTDTGRIGSIGIIAAFSIALLISSSFGILLAINEKTTEANVLNIITIGLFFIQFFIIKASVNVLNDVEITTNYHSSHLRWANQMREIAHQCKSDELKVRLEKFADDCNYFSRDLSPNSTDINLAIEIAIKKLSLQVSQKNYEIAISTCEELDRLSQQRDRDLKAGRSKA
jgi:hypothetical protein